jgi:D-tyrosyl-tRNA(Tyr) deacylase
MRAVVERVKEASVRTGDGVVGEIGQGLLVLLAIHQDDNEASISKMAEKLIALRIFSDDTGKMNLSVKDMGGEILVVSQFTLYGDARSGNRPSFIEAAKPEKARSFYEQVVTKIRDERIKVETGRFGAQMEVSIINDGPVTLIIDI